MNNEGAIPPLLGSMVDAGPGEMGLRRLDVTYKQAHDLAIASIVSAYFHVPDHYQSRGGVQVFGRTPKDTKLLQGTGLALGPAGDVRFPWMDGTTYPLAVWYYSVRQVRACCLLRRPSTPSAYMYACIATHSLSPLPPPPTSPHFITSSLHHFRHFHHCVTSFRCWL